MLSLSRDEPKSSLRMATGVEMSFLSFKWQALARTERAENEPNVRLEMGASRKNV